MGLIATDKGGKNFDPIPQGIHQAISYGIYDLGTHFSEKFGKSNHKVLIIWEVSKQRIDIEKEGELVNLPRAISKQYTLSLHQKSNLRKDLESWRGRAFTVEELKGFDLKRVLGANCSLQILHKTVDDKTYANVSSVLPMMEGMTKLNAENELRFFSFEDNGHDIPEGTPDWIKDIITKADEWEGTKYEEEESPPDMTEEDPGFESEDDIPF